MMEAVSGDILLVEDDPGIAALQKRRLERAGYAVTTASTAEEALQRVAEAEPEVVLLDYGLPGGVTGLDLYGRLKDAGYEMPVIIVTGQADESTVIESLRAGARDFITKSAEYLDYLPEAVGRVLTQVRTERRLEELEQRFRATFQQAAVGIAQVDPQGRWLTVNERLRQILGRTTASLSEPTLGEVLHPDDRDAGMDQYRRLLAGEVQTYSEECRLVRGDGSEVWVNLTASLVREASGEPGYSVLIVEDITERKRLQEQLAYRTFYDPLTDLPNRTLFRQHVEHALEHVEAVGSVTVLVTNIQDFREINDGLGHEAGDELLSAVAERLQACLRPEDTAARLGGGEFAVLLESASNLGEGVRAAERIADQMSTPFTIHGNRVSIKTRTGIAPGGAPGQAADDLLRNAGTAMHRADGAGDSNYTIYDEGVDQQALARFRLADELEDAFRRGELKIYYQPEVLLASGRISGVSASVAWEHPGRGVIPPGELLLLAQEAGLSFRISAWLLREAAGQVRHWQDTHPSGMRLTLRISLSPVEFRYPGLEEQISGVLEETGLEPGGLVLGVAESAVMQDAESSLTTFRELKARGVLLSLEGFGGGYSSLAYLDRFPLDLVELDRMFTDALGGRSGEAAVAAAIVDLAHTLGSQTVAAGVEHGEQAEKLRELGFDLARGGYFAGASTAEEIGSDLADNPALTVEMPPTDGT